MLRNDKILRLSSLRTFLRLHTFVLSILLISSTCSLRAQDRIYSHFETKDAFQDCEIFHVMEDSEGKIWFSTDQGAIVYDGTDFQRITSVDGLPDNTIFECYEDFKGRIWFVSYSFQLSYYENDRVHEYKYNHIIQEKFVRNPLYDARSFYVDDQEVVHVGSSRSFYITIDKNGDTVDLLAQGKYKRGNYCFQKGNRCFGASNDVNSLDFIIRTETSEKHYPNFFQDYISERCEFSAASFRGNLFFSRGNNVFLMDKKPRSVLQFKTKIIYFNIVNDKFLIAPFGKGLWEYRWHNDSLHLINSQFNGKSVSSYLEDSEGGIWITTLHDGVYYSPNNYIHAISGTEEQFIEKIDYAKETNRITFTNSNEETFTFIAGKTKPKKVLEYSSEPVHDKEWHYSSLRNQLISWKLDPHSNKIQSRVVAEHPAFPVSLQAVNERIFWITINSISEYDPSRDIFIEDIFRSEKSRIECLHIKDKTWYVGLKNGIIQIDGENKTNLSKLYPELKQRITAITNIGNDIFICTRNNGIYIIREKKLIHFGTKQGLIGDLILTMKKTDNYIWVLTPQGISRIHPKSLRITNRMVFSKLLNYSLKDFVVREKDMILATSKGLLSLDLELFDTPVFRRKIYFDKIVLGSKNVNNGKIGRVQHNSNAIRFKVNGAPISMSSNLVYKYRLIKNGDVPSEWNYSDRNEVNFPFLEPGDYTFEISVANSEYPYKPIKYHFIISPPFWKTLWFIGLVIGILLLIILVSVRSYHSVKLKRLKRKQTLQNQVYKFKQLALSRQINPHFIFNSLNSIQSFIIKNDKVLSTDFLSKFGHLIRKMLDHCQNDLVTVKEELEIISQYLELEQLRFDNSFSWTINTPEHNIQTMRIPPAILQPIVENAIWHGLMPSKKKRIIMIDFEQQGETVICRIMDNGIGRKASEQMYRESTRIRKSKGNIITKERLKILNSYYQTKFKFEIFDLEPHTEEDFVTIVELHLSSI